MKLILSDTTSEVLDAWKVQFLERPEVEIRSSPLLEAGGVESFLLPGNSFGFLDSGLGLALSEKHGWELQDELRARIQGEFDGELLVGQAVVIRRPGLPGAIVYAPVWRTPRRLVGTINVFLAVRAALLAARREAIHSMAVGGLGVLEGELDPRISARQIRYAYEVFIGERGLADKNLTQQLRRERKLMSVPGILKEQGGAEVGPE